MPALWWAGVLASGVLTCGPARQPLPRLCLLSRRFAFISAVTNLSIAIFLVTPGTQVATFSILGLIGDNRLEAASALTTALLGVTFLVVILAWRVSRGARLVPGVVDA